MIQPIEPIIPINVDFRHILWNPDKQAVKNLHRMR